MVNCPICKSEDTTWIDDYERHFCRSCGNYLPDQINQPTAVREFEAEHIEKDFMESMLVNMVSGSRPVANEKASLGGVYERIRRLEGGIEYLNREAPEFRCMLASDLRLQVARLEAQLDKVDPKKRVAKVGKWKVPFRWGSVITAAVTLLLLVVEVFGDVIFAIGRALLGI